MQRAAAGLLATDDRPVDKCAPFFRLRMAHVSLVLKNPHYGKDRVIGEVELLRKRFSDLSHSPTLKGPKDVHEALLGVGQLQRFLTGHSFTPKELKVILRHATDDVQLII